MTDYITNETYDGVFPQLGIVFIMLPIMTILYLIRKYDLPRRLPAGRNRRATRFWTTPPAKACM